MHVLRLAVPAEPVQGQFYRRTRGQHSVSQHQYLAFQRRHGGIFDVDVKFVAPVVFPVGGHESAVGVVETVEKPLVERNSGAQYGCYDQSGPAGVDAGYAKRGLHLEVAIFQDLADLIAENLSYPFEVGAEAHPVFLDGFVADLSDEVVEYAVCFSKVYDFHNVRFFVLRTNITIFHSIIHSARLLNPSARDRGRAQR